MARAQQAAQAGQRERGAERNVVYNYVSLKVAVTCSSTVSLLALGLGYVKAVSLKADMDASGKAVQQRRIVEYFAVLGIEEAQPPSSAISGGQGGMHASHTLSRFTFYFLFFTYRARYW